MKADKSKSRGKSNNSPKNTHSKVKKFKVDDFDEKAIFLCQFCGGVACDQQDYLKNKIQPNAIEGLHSNWINDDILAMQRPSERLIKQFNLYNVFKQSKIGTVLNLQQPGEHPFCGDGIIPDVGFSYIPENFYSHGIRWFNQCWEDMTSTTFQHMMKIMNIFDTTIQSGSKISVHCHAGRGRTLLVICAWLIYGNRVSAADTIKLAIEKRQGSLSSSSQRKFLHQFQKQLNERWRSFGISPQHKTFTDFVQWQTTSLLTRQKKYLQKCPIMHRQLLISIRRFLSKNNKEKLIQALLNPQNVIFQHKFDSNHEKSLSQMKNKCDQLFFQRIQSEQDPRIIAELFYDYYDDLPYTLLTSITIEHLHEEASKMQQQGGESSYLKILAQPLIVHDIGVSTLAVMLDYCHFLKQIQGSLMAGKEQSHNQNEQDQKINRQIMQSLYMRFALLLLSKKKYYPQLFPLKNIRECKIPRYINKIKKIVSPQILFFADFLRKLSNELPKELQQVYRIIFKVCKIDSNLYYLTQNSKSQFYTFEAKNEMYKNARQNIAL